ncbi:mannosyltransferase [Pedobacter foliorum]|uniref:mannosyltransferase n=1 Tax=Pedobacter foliorum TaxID=2739058 RepID=UPI00156721D1|nr:mannosyltransferase [Pedobacter foliorum]NRF38561.1 mannosyltransferase [Pedobacter foliorum]
MKNPVIFHTRFRLVILLVIALIYIIATVFSDGYHHFDEHYQIIEFAGLKAGWNDGSTLTWEYNAQIRPSLQPYIALIIIKLCNFTGIHNPFFIASVLRILTGMLAVYAISLFMRSFETLINKENRIGFLFISFCLWFLPIINIRFSSETWAGLFLLISVALINLNKNGRLHYLTIGVLLGLSFEFRFQMALCVVGIFFWLLLTRKIRLLDLFFICFGFVIVVIICTFLDYLYYESFNIVPYNYFKVNLLDNVASSYGVSPWYFYIIEILNRPSFFIGCTILVSFILLILFKPKSLIVWCIIPYILAHIMISHKETRFLFPLINFVPLMLIEAYQILFQKAQTFPKKSVRATLLFIFFLWNFAGLLFIFKPAGYGQVNLAAYLYKNYYNGKRLDLYTTGFGPISFGTAKGGVSRFYMSEYFNNHVIEGSFIPYTSQKMFVAIPMYDSERRGELERAGFVLKKSSIPAFLRKLNQVFHVYDDGYTLLLYVKEGK